MSDPAAADRAAGPAGGGPAALTVEAVESLLAEFTAWASGGRQAPDGLRNQGPDGPRSPVDLFTLVGQFTALRHEVNLQTKAARAATEQAAETVKALAAPRPEPAAEPDGLRETAKAVIDIADALGRSLRQMEQLRDGAEDLLASGGREPPDDPPRPGFFARLWRAGGVNPPVLEAAATPHPAADKLRPLAAAAADGYALSLRRVERLLPTLELEHRPCYGEMFDPEWMEAVEVVGGTGEPPGTVVEEVRAGYLWRGKPFRAAQVRVAR